MDEREMFEAWARSEGGYTAQDLKVFNGQYFDEHANTALDAWQAARRTTPDRDEWQPIETAPKDRTIQLWVPAIGIFVDGPWRGRWSYVAHQWVLDTPFREPDGKGVSVSSIPIPTHWMPLPTAPLAIREVRDE